MFDVEDNLFLLAGPVRMHPRVVRAMAVPALAHRSPEFTAVNRELFERIGQVYQTSGPVLSLTGSGTAAMDAAIGSLVGPEDRAVALDNGKFGNRMAGLSTRYAGEVDIVTGEWGQPVDLATVKEKLEGAKALVLTHNETSTGFIHPLEELARAAHDAGALVIADCITSIAGTSVPVDDWGIDACITGSQKCLGAPAGLSFVSLSERARGALVPHPAYYLDLAKYVKKFADGQTPFTPATHLHLATLEALRVILEEGLEARFAKVDRTARATRAAAEALGLELFAHPEHRSPTVTAMRIPEGLTDDQVRGGLKKMGIVAAGAQAAIKGKVFRIGHMGTVDVRDIAAFFTVLEVLFDGLGHKVDQGASARAIASVVNG